MNQTIFYNKTINKKELKAIINLTFEFYGIVKASELAENLKKSGFYFATKAGISISIEDLKVPPTKDSLFSNNDRQLKIAYLYEKRGNISEVERFQKVIDSWHNTSDLVKNQLIEFFKNTDPLNPVYMMAFSGARGNLSQVRQLVGMRGLMADPKGQIIDLPIKANFREGLTITDYIISSYGARKGIVDTALKTADSGYLTRRLVDVAQHIIIRELDCKTKNGIRIYYKFSETKFEKLLGRVLAKSLFNKATKKILLIAGTTLTTTSLNQIKFSTDLILRSPLICESSRSICQKCYGWNLAQGHLAELADAVGVIAAQSIGEPGTQLTMRTFHTGGVFTGESSNQIRSGRNGQILFSGDLKTIVSRTIYGEIILKAKNTVPIFVLSSDKELIKVPIKIEMLIFVQNKSYIQKNDLIAEIPNRNKQTIKQIKNVVSNISGEVQFQNFKTNQISTLKTNGLIWIATGKVYDIPLNAKLKTSGKKVIKDNALAQTKIIAPINGIIKNKSLKTRLELSLIHNFTIFNFRNLFKNGLNLCLKLNNKYKILVFSEISRNEIPTNMFGIRLTKKYTFPISSELFYAKQKTQNLWKFGIYLLKPLYPIGFFEYQTTQELIDPKICGLKEKSDLNKKLLFPGETLFPNLDITQLSYCESTLTKDLSVTYQIQPVAQCSVVNLSKYTYFNRVKNFNYTNIVNKIIPIYNSGTLIKANQVFLLENLKFLSLSNKVKLQTVVKCFSFESTQKTHFASLLVNKLPTNLIESTLQQSKPNISISYLTPQNQYIDAYSVIATLNSFVKETLTIKALKNLKERSSRTLITTDKNYKNYRIKKTENFQSFNFVTVGDKINRSKFISHSGYITSLSSSKNLNIRLCLPFFISMGTQIFVQHGSLIQDREAFCRLTFNRIISSDIVTGLPRVENLLEARRNKNPGLLIENPGIVKYNPETECKILVLEKRESRIYKGANLLTFKQGEFVFVAQPIDTSLLNPHSVLQTYFKYYCSFYTAKRATRLSMLNIQILILNLVQEVYTSQGIFIADKHIEIIIRQITSKVKLLRFKMDTFFIPKEFIEFNQVNYMNKALKIAKEELIEYQPTLLGITKVSLMTESFISAASFQETTRVLAQASVEGRVEWLRGLKENVILGRLIPAGTGFKSFNTTPLLDIRLQN